MREIKFRAWNKEWNVMYASCLPVPVGTGWHFTLDEGVPSTPIEMSDRYEFMQFTGLKDKNGVEIYEGDIVNAYSQKYLNQNGDTGFYLNGRPTRVIKWLFGEHRNGWNIYNGKRSQFEVIGNIYENPELLTKQKEEM